MEDDRGLELSLGLPCGGSSSNSKDRSGNSADVKTDDERTSKIVNDFKNFLNAGIPQSFQRPDPVKQQESFFNDLSQTASGGNASANVPEPGDKRKSKFDETSKNKKQEIETCSSGLHDKGKTSHVSITTDEGSTADNEDGAESEEGSSSRIVPQREDRSKTPVRSGSSTWVPRENHGKVNIGAVPHYGVQPSNTFNVPYSLTIKEGPPVSAPSTSSYPSSSMAPTIPSTNGEGPGRIMPTSFGYSQLPVLDKDNPWGFARPQALHSPYVGRPILTSAPIPNPGSSEATQLDVRPAEPSKGQTKPPTEEGSSSQPEDDSKGRLTNSFPSEYPSIRPGLAATDVKIGGSGSFPNLPWVSTTGPGPNGKTISGVTYKYNATQIKIVCACHAIHMSADEFVQHAASEQSGGVTTSSMPATTPTSNPAPSARS